MPKHRSIRSSNAHFAMIPNVGIPRSKFDRSHGVKMTFDADYLYPFYVDEMLPGDTFNGKLHAFVRLSTPSLPVMDNLYLDTFFFFVPNRLLWDNWETFITGENGAKTVPKLTATTTTGFAVGTLADYMGLPP